VRFYNSIHHIGLLHLSCHHHHRHHHHRWIDPQLHTMNSVTNNPLIFVSTTGCNLTTEPSRRRRQRQSHQQLPPSRMVLMAILMTLYLPISSVFCATHKPAFVRIPSSTRKPPPLITTSSTLYFDRPHHYRASNSTGGGVGDMVPTLIHTPQSPSPTKAGTSSTELASSMMDVVADGATTRNSPKTFKVYCDMDGVLVDFEKGVVRLLNAAPSNLIKGTMWKTIARAPQFFENLEWTNDGKHLWQAIRHLKPDILTGVPYPKTSRVEKFNWCKRELQLEEAHFVDYAAGYKDHECVNGNTPREGSTNIITCWSNNKYKEARNGS
jgi:hypothetical protein